MARVKRGVTSHAKHKKVLKQVKGQYGRRKKYNPRCKTSSRKSNAICLQRSKGKKKRV